MLRSPSAVSQFMLPLAGLVLASTDVRSARAVVRPHPPRTLRAATLFHQPAARLDPARLRDPGARTLARNLYGRPIEFDAHGILTAGLAREFEWRGDVLSLSFPIDGTEDDPVTAADAAFSIKRLLMLSSPVERAARDFFCPGVTLRTPDDGCDGIVVAGDELRLGPIAPGLRAQVVRLLTRPEFGIVRRAAVDASGRVIVDPTRSTGAYRVDVDDATGAWHLTARTPGAPNAPAEIQLVPIAGRTPLGDAIDFATGEAADFIDGPAAHEHRTLPLRLRVLRFSARGRARRADERAAVARVIASALRDRRAQAADQLLPPRSHGAIGRGRAARALGAAFPGQTPARAFVLAVDDERYPEAAARLANVSSVRVERGARDADVTLAEVEWTWTEDVEALKDLVINRLFHTRESDAVEWLARYGRTPNRAARAALLRAAHARALATGMVYPVDARSRRTVANRAWTFHTSPFATDIEFRHVRAGE